ncbi:hypothetical protein TWF718_010460 [Orbilia javanica]|uniref:Uncharacterized protein n=1 Tax=Orbilia javanica TaxID=47235 RepID=A0AAN8MS18_9PEZI
MVCVPPDIPERHKKQIYQILESSPSASTVDTLFASGRTSWPSGHYRKCTSDLSEGTFRALIATAISQITDFHIEDTSFDDDFTHVYYQFDTRPRHDKDDGSEVRGVDWGESGVHIYECKDTEMAEVLFKRWLRILFPGWIPFPVNIKECGVGQYALEQNYGLVYWIRDNIFVKIDIDDSDISCKTVYRLARAIDAHLIAGSILIGNNE